MKTKIPFYLGALPVLAMQTMLMADARFPERASANAAVGLVLLTISWVGVFWLGRMAYQTKPPR